MLHLEATESEMRHVLLIREEEFEWLEECECHAYTRERTHGNLELLQTEINRHEVRKMTFYVVFMLWWCFVVDYHCFCCCCHCIIAIVVIVLLSCYHCVVVIVLLLCRC